MGTYPSVDHQTNRQSPKYGFSYTSPLIRLPASNEIPESEHEMINILHYTEDGTKPAFITINNRDDGIVSATVRQRDGTTATVSMPTETLDTWRLTLNRIAGKRRWVFVVPGIWRAGCDDTQHNQVKAKAFAFCPYCGRRTEFGEYCDPPHAQQ